MNHKIKQSIFISAIIFANSTNPMRVAIRACSPITQTRLALSAMHMKNMLHSTSPFFRLTLPSRKLTYSQSALSNGLSTQLTPTSFVNFSPTYSSTKSIVKLTPPPISKNTVLEEIYCDRPRRQGRFNISLEVRGNKIIVNCNGHGGSGWTTVFGSVRNAIKEFLKTNPSKTTPIRIIGSGCMGLATACELSRLGYKVAGISTKSIYDMPSWRAAGYFALVSVDTSPKDQQELDEIGLNTFMTYQDIEKENHPYIGKEAVKFMPVYCSEDTESGVEALERSGRIPKKEHVTLDFQNGVLRPGFIKYMTYFMNTTTIMRQLTNAVNKLRIPIEINSINSFDDIKETIIFNCAGLGSREINNDNLITAVRGHLITLKESAIDGHMKYMIYTKVNKDDYIYLFPKNISVTPSNIDGVNCAGVLGGTFIPDMDKLSVKEQEKINREKYQQILNLNSEFYYGKRFIN